MADRPIRVQRSRRKGWRMDEAAGNGLCPTVYVGRPSRWGNPWRVGDTFHEGAVGGDPWQFTSITTAKYAVECYERALAQPDRAKFVKSIVKELRGKNLCCWCRLCFNHAGGKPLGEHCDDCDPCHVDVLLEIANTEPVPTSPRPPSQTS